MLQEIITYSILVSVGIWVIYRLYNLFAPQKITAKTSGCASGCGGCDLKSKCSSVKIDSSSSANAGLKFAPKQH